MSIPNAESSADPSIRPEEWSERLQKLNLLVDQSAPDAVAACADTLAQLERTPPAFACRELVECLLVVAKYYYHLGAPTPAIRAASIAVANARALQDKHLLRKAYTFRGAMLSEGGDVAGSLEDCLLALQFACELEAPGLERPIWNNMGQVLQQAGQYSQAISCLEKATVGPNVFSDKYGDAIPYENIASCAICTRDSRKGIEAAKIAIRLNPSPLTADACLGRVIAESNLARLLTQVGDVARAEVHSHTAIAFAKMYPTNRGSFIANNASGLVEIHRGLVDAGTARLNYSLEQVRKHFPGQLHDALAVCAAGFEAAGKPDLALACLQELLDVNRQRRLTEIARFQCLAQGFVVVGQTLNSSAPECLSAVTARLKVQIEARVRQLIHTAIIASVASGYDLNRIFRVAKLATGFAEALDWSSEQRNCVALAAKLFDVGMIAIPEVLLAKSSAPSDSEKKLIGEHTRIGRDLLIAADLEILEPCISIALLHHEHWDGSGPGALRGQEIPLQARLVGLCDVFDALIHPRPWRSAMTVPEALAEMQQAAGSQFDPELVTHFASHIRELHQQEPDLDEFFSSEAKEDPIVQTHTAIAAMLA